MPIIKINPIGSCNGVKNALQKMDEIIKENEDKSIYIIGSFLHNENIINYYKSLNCKFISLEEAEDCLKAINPANSVVVFSAHGHDKNLEKICISSFISFYDLTCYNVNKNLTLADFYKSKYPIIFIGKANHEETIAFTSRPNTYVYDIKTKLDFNKITTNTIIVIPQTTISEIDFNNALKNIKAKISNALIFDGRCNQVSSRIEILNKTKIDGSIIVVGSSSSSNTKEIYNVAKSKTKNAYLVNSINDINFEISKDETYYLTSGCSALDSTVEEIYNYIKEKQN